MVQNPTPHLDNRYEKLLGDDYTTKLKAIGINSSTILQGSSREIYFLLTIKGHDVAYPITKICNGLSCGSTNERGILINHIYDVPLFIDFGKYNFGIRFECRYLIDISGMVFEYFLNFRIYCICYIVNKRCFFH